ncbi:MAG: HupE/UreJ family protein [Rhodothermales bacterium]
MFGNTAFSVYFQLGLEHILDLAGYDHILFVVALAAMYGLKEWRQLLILVTAFTLGHSLTLALATLGLVTVDSDLVEFLIPLTILATALYNIGEGILSAGNPNHPDPAHPFHHRTWRIKYLLAAFFGLIHGLGFSNFLRAVLGGEQSLFLPLLSFNVGLEIGQIVILGVVIVAGSLITRLSPLTSRTWGLFVSGCVALATLTMIF